MTTEVELTPIDPGDPRPVYLQIADGVRDSIRSGRLGPGSQLPSEQQMIDSYGVARGTVRQAVNVLLAEGLVETQHGRGKFVREQRPVKRVGYDRFARRHREEGKAAFLAEVEASGFDESVEVIEVKRTRPTIEVAERLQISPKDPVLIRRRRYFADGHPMETATSWIPWAIADGTPMVQDNPGPGGIYARIEEGGRRLQRFEEEVRARMPTAEEARSLRLRPATPVFELTRTAYAESDEPVEVCETVMASDRFVLAYRLPAT